MSKEKLVNENTIKSEDLLLKIEDLSVGFKIGKKIVNAVEGLSLEVKKGRNFGTCRGVGFGKISYRNLNI